jgi:hypothetical protein
VPDTPSPRDVELVERFVGYLSLERRLSPHTAAAYRGDLLGLATFLARGGSGLQEVTYPVLRRWLAHLSTRGYARASIARKAAAARSFYRNLSRRRVVEISPAARLSAPKVPTSLPPLYFLHTTNPFSLVRTLLTSDCRATAEAKGGWDPTAPRGVGNCLHSPSARWEISWNFPLCGARKIHATGELSPTGRSHLYWVPRTNVFESCLWT